jgi:hypothetical protein
MMTLPPPAIGSLQLLDEVIAQRQNGVNAEFFNDIAVEWRQRVRGYIANNGSPEFVPTWNNIMQRKNTFLNLYGSPSEGSAQGLVLADMRKDHGLTYCPACGEPGTPNTLDHYLPKTLYPHFCVTPLNLFPMCDACQELKDVKTGDAVTPRFFIHPYYDVFVANQVIELGFGPPYSSPVFELRPTRGLSASQRQLVLTHVRELRIDTRYIKYFKTQHRRLLRLVGKLRDSQQNVRASLTAFRDSAAISGNNVWDHVFYAAVVSHPALLDYLENEPLPTFL